MGGSGSLVSPVGELAASHSDFFAQGTTLYRGCLWTRLPSVSCVRFPNAVVSSLSPLSLELLSRSTRIGIFATVPGGSSCVGGASLSWQLGVVTPPGMSHALLWL